MARDCYAAGVNQSMASPWCKHEHCECRQRNRGRLGNESAKCRRGERLLIEIARQRCEVGGVDKAVVVEIALNPELSRRAAKVARQGVEIERIHKPVEIRVAAPGVADDD